MALYLVQHGRSRSKEIDPERGLSDQGYEEVRFIADSASDHHLNVSRIYHSGKKRASQTASIFREELRPVEGMAAMEGLNPNDDVTAVAATLASSHDAMLVGHLPFLEKLASYLITGDPDKPIVKLQNGGIVCLEQDEKASWYIKWTLFPLIE